MMLNCTASFGNVPMSLLSCKRPGCEVVHIVLAMIISYLQSIQHQKANQNQTAQACGRDMLQQSMEQFIHGSGGVAGQKEALTDVLLIIHG